MLLRTDSLEAKEHARRQRGGRGAMPPRFSFLPPQFFFCPRRYFLGGRSCCSWAEKTLKFATSARKSRRISAKIFFFIFGDHLLLIEKFVISARKSLRISAKTFAPLILILPPRSREAGDAPAKDTGASVFKKNFFQAISKKGLQKIFASARVT